MGNLACLASEWLAAGLAAWVWLVSQLFSCRAKHTGELPRSRYGGYGFALRQVSARDCGKGPHVEFPGSLGCTVCPSMLLCIEINVSQSLDPTSCQ